MLQEQQQQQQPDQDLACALLELGAAQLKGLGGWLSAHAASAGIPR
jgi:hypothetical protein